MARNSKISWTDDTLNICTGCTKISPGCANCYVEPTVEWLGRMRLKKYENGFTPTVHERLLLEPLRWRKPRKVFVNSMSDTYHPAFSDSIIEKQFDVMRRTPKHIYMVLTKRVERMLQLSRVIPWPDNVWAGVTIENANYAYRGDILRMVPAKIRFYSCEPLIGAVPNIKLDGIHWVIVGGESGKNARPMQVEWALEIRDKCIEKDVAFFFKQMGGSGKDKGGCLLDGKKYKAFPTV